MKPAEAIRRHKRRVARPNGRTRYRDVEAEAEAKPKTRYRDEEAEAKAEPKTVLDALLSYQPPEIVISSPTLEKAKKQYEAQPGGFISSLVAVERVEGKQRLTDMSHALQHYKDKQAKDEMAKDEGSDRRVSGLHLLLLGGGALATLGGVWFVTRRGL